MSDNDESGAVAPEKITTPKRQSWVTVEKSKKTTPSPRVHSSTQRYERDKHSVPGRSVFSLLSSHHETNPTPRKPSHPSGRKDSAASWVVTQERVSINWINSLFPNQEIQVNDLSTDLRNGIVLIHIMETLTGKPVIAKYHQQPAHQLQMLDNMEVAFGVIKDEGIKLISASPTDIVDGNLKLTLGLIYELIKHYHINFGVKNPKSSKKSPLLSWFQMVLPRAEISNLTTDWSNGRNLSTLVDFYKPGLIPDHASLDPDDSLQNVTNAMNLAEKEFNVPQVLHPEDIATNQPDEFMMKTYLSFFCNNGSIGQAHLLKWINKFLPNKTVENFTDDWKDGKTLCTLVESLAPGSTPLTVDECTPVEVTKKAIESAKESLGVESMFTPEEICNKDNDQLPLLVYLAQLQSLGIKPSVMPHKFTADGSGVDGTEIEKEATISIHGEGELPDELTILVTSPDGSTTDITKVTGVPEYLYTPTMAGMYTVDISYQGDPISGSPYHVMHTDPSLAGKCKVEGNVSKRRVNIPAQFKVDCREGGKGKLSAVIENTKGEALEVMIIPEPDGTFIVKYTPDSVGVYTAYINWNGTPIHNSPFNFDVCDPNMCKVFPAGLSNAIQGFPTQFDVDTRDAGPGTLTASVQSPSAPVDLDLITKDDEGVYTYEYIPKHAETYNIEIKWCGFQIPGSPFIVHPTKPTIASNVFVREMPINRMLINKPITVIIDATESTDADISGAVQGPSTDVDCEMKLIETGVYAATFYPKEIGEYTMDIYYGGSIIPDCPLHFTINDPSKCKVDDFTKKVYYINKPVTFSVFTGDAGEGDVTSTVTGPSGSSVDCDVTEETDGCSLVSFTPSQGGRYAITPYFDNRPILLHPTVVHIESETLDDIVVSRPALPHTRYYLINEPLELQMFAPNREGKGFAVNALGKESGANPSVLSLEPTGEDSYNIQFKAAISDDYKLHITYNGMEIPQSPLLLVVRQAPCAEKVITFDQVIPLKAGNFIELIFDTSQAGDGGLDNIKAEISTDYGVVIMHNIEEIAPNLYRVSFKVRQNDTFIVHVKWFDKPVTGSPFTIPFVEQSADPKIAAEFEPGIGPRVILTANVTCRETGLQEDVDLRQYERGKYRISFSPQEKEVYELRVFLFDQEIKGSPFIVDLTTPVQRSKPHGVQYLELIELLMRGGVLSANVVEKKTNTPVPIEPLKLSEDGSKVHIVFDDHKKELYDLFVYWNHRLVKGAPFELDVSK